MFTQKWYNLLNFINPVKKIIISIIICLIVIIGALAGYLAYNANKVQGLISDSRQLSASGKYKEAMSSLNEAKKMDTIGRFLTEISDEIRNNEPLVQSQNDFNKGKVYYDESEYQTAIWYLKRVSKRDISYESSKTYIDLAEKKLFEDNNTNKGSVAGVSASNQTSQPLTVPTYFPINKVENLEALCEADASSFKSQARLKWDQMITQQRNENKNIYNDPVWGPATESRILIMLEQFVANVNNVASLRKIWCLEHDRDYSSFVAPEIKYVF